jgi:hypothetical protein
MPLVKCRECGKEISSQARSCPHCGATPISKTATGCAAIGVLIFIFFSISIFTGNHNDNSKSARKWETISGIQEGIKIVMDIDDNSIQRTSDGVSATVDVKLNDGDIENITYICRMPDPTSDMHGGVIWKNNLNDLPYGSTGEAIMKRVCYGPLP